MRVPVANTSFGRLDDVDPSLIADDHDDVPLSPIARDRGAGRATHAHA